MLRLVDGAFAVVSKAPWDSEVRSLAHSRRRTVSAEHAAELAALAHGLPDDTEPGPLFHELSALGLADRDLPAVDAAVAARLTELGEGFRWHLRAHKRAPALVELLRRAHSRRKLSLFEHGQTACLPESGVLRCLEMTARMGERKRVLLIGDDDLLSLPLSALGHQVTVVDIDELLINFLRRVADEEGLVVDARVQDVLAPMPAELQAAFDVVITDPMSYESCFTAVLSRAVSAVPVGGAIFTCVHPLARTVFRKVAWGLPVVVQEYLAELSAYYYEGFIENWYRSDMVVLRRGTGEPRWLTTDAIPLSNIIAGQLTDRMHGFTDVKPVPFQRPTFADIESALDDLLARLGTSLEKHVRVDERYAHYYAALKDGGHVALVLDRASGAFSYDLFPCTRELEGAFCAAFGRMMPLARTVTFHREAIRLGAPAPTTVRHKVRA